MTFFYTSSSKNIRKRVCIWEFMNAYNRNVLKKLYGKFQEVQESLQNFRRSHKSWEHLLYKTETKEETKLEKS